MQYKECVSDIKNKIYMEISEYDKKKNELDDILGKKGVLKEIKDTLLAFSHQEIKENSILLSLQFPICYDDIGESLFNKLYSIVSRLVSLENIGEENFQEEINKANQQYKTFCKKIEDDYQEMMNKELLLQKELRKEYPRMIEYRRILSNYRYKGLITPRQIELMIDLMKQYEMDRKDQIRVLESVRINNDEVRYENPKISYTVVNMLDEKFKKYEIDAYDHRENKQNLSGLVESFYQNLIKEDDVEGLLAIMPSLDDGTYQLDQFDYIYQSLINRFIDELEDRIDSISQVDIYSDMDLRKVVIQEYNDIKRRYNKICFFYQNTRQKYCYQEELKEALLSADTEVKNHLIYLRPNFKEESYLEKDIFSQSFPEEYLERVKRLLDGKKYDILSSEKDRTFTSTNRNWSKHQELRDDQVRIFYQHLRDNYYLILGAFVKKRNNDIKMCNMIGKRVMGYDLTDDAVIDAFIQEDNNEIDSRIYSCIEERARKGNR